MNLFRYHPIFVAILAIGVLAIGAEGWYFLTLRGQERALEVELNQKIAEIERLQNQRPGPTDQNLRRAREDFAQNAEVLGTMLRSLNVSGGDELEYFKGEPSGRTEAFFDIVQFVDSTRTNASSAEVFLRPEERFGFSAYTYEGPEPELIRAVYRQRRIVEYLLTALFAARPQALVSVQREDPATIGPRDASVPVRPAPAAQPRPVSSFAGGKGQGDAGPASDIFTIDPQISARTPDYVDTMAFRITFVGHTSSLRGFMNSLAMPEIPLVVRSVEVEPLHGDAAGARPGGAATPERRASASGTDHAIVADNASRFIVTIELFEVKIRAPEIPVAPAS